MIDIRIMKSKAELELKVKKTKLWLAQKELVEYTAWKALPENEKDRSAVEKVVAKLKLEDDVWMEKEEELSEQEALLKTLNLIIETLQSTMRAMSRHEDVSKDYFEEIQGVYINELLGE